MQKIENPVVSSVYIDRKKYTVQSEIDTAIASVVGGQMNVSVEIRQTVPNTEHKDEVSKFLDLSFRLQGHEKAIEVKENKSLVVFNSMTKEAYLASPFKVGFEFKGYTLKEEYLPFSSFSTTNNGVDKEGNVMVEPITNPTSKEVLLYASVVVDDNGEILREEEVPYGRFVSIVKGEYTPVQKKKHSSTKKDFTGEKKKDGRRTTEYQEWLNGLYDFKRIDFLENVNLHQTV